MTLPEMTLTEAVEVFIRPTEHPKEQVTAAVLTIQATWNTRIKEITGKSLAELADMYVLVHREIKNLEKAKDSLGALLRASKQSKIDGDEFIGVNIGDNYVRQGISLDELEKLRPDLYQLLGDLEFIKNSPCKGAITIRTK